MTLKQKGILLGLCVYVILVTVICIVVINWMTTNLQFTLSKSLSSMWPLLIYLLIIGLVFIVMLMVGINRLINHLNHMVIQVTRIAQTQNFSERIHSTGPIELQRLASEINNLIDQLKLAYEHLTSKTHELQTRIHDLERIKQVTVESELYAEEMRKENERLKELVHGK